MSGHGLMGRARGMLGSACERDVRGDETNPVKEEKLAPPRGRGGGMTAKITGDHQRLHLTKGDTRSLSERGSMQGGANAMKRRDDRSGGGAQASPQTGIPAHSKGTGCRQAAGGKLGRGRRLRRPLLRNGPPRCGVGVNPAWRKESAAGRRHRQGGPRAFNITQEELYDG
jgi:hypothetical protein